MFWFRYGRRSADRRTTFFICCEMKCLTRICGIYTRFIGLPECSHYGYQYGYHYAYQHEYLYGYNYDKCIQYRNRSD